MKVLDLKSATPRLEDLLKLAKDDSVLIRSKDGKEFLLEETDEFEKEVRQLGSSEKFMSFLAERAKEPATIPIEHLAKDLGIRTAKGQKP